jgi:hypothetical protein
MNASLKSIVLLGIVMIAAAVGPLIFPAAMAGRGTLSQMATHFLLPSIAVLAVVTILAHRWRLPFARLAALGGVAGVIATVPLEVIRLTAFHFHYMPGNLPRLMGVLLLDRFALGPSVTSDIAGWAYHFWNGACFAILYVVIFGTTRRWLGALYGVAIGVGFLVSPVVTSLGIGKFGLEYSVGFPITVTLAHVAYGATLGFLVARLAGQQPSPVFQSLREIFAATHPATRLACDGHPQDSKTLAWSGLKSKNGGSHERSKACRPECGNPADGRAHEHAAGGPRDSARGD